MRSNDGCCNNVPIRFASAKEMFEYLQDVGDLYSPDERIYVFNYSESGALESTLEVHKTDSSLNSFTLNYFFNIFSHNRISPLSHIKNI